MRTSSRSSRTSPADAARTSCTTLWAATRSGKSTKCIAFEGRILVVGFASGDIPSAALNHALVKNYSIVGLHWGLYRQRDPGAIAECHAELTRLVAAGTIRPLISERLTLADVPDGLRRLAAGATIGRLVFLP